MESCDNTNYTVSDKYLCKIKPYVNKKYNNQKFPLSYRQSCSVYERLSNSTFLALLGKQSEKIQGTIQEIYKNSIITLNCETIGDVKNSVCKIVYSLSREFFENIPYPWSVTSFDSKSRKVCVEIQTPYGTRYISAIVPEQISKSN